MPLSSSAKSVKERKFKLPESGSGSKIADMGSNLAVICTHPWGPLGGNMNNNVVLAILVWFQRLKITTMRFDFCGSQFGRGGRQVDQVREAANFLLTGQHQINTKTSSSSSESRAKKTPPKFILLIGYSYGSIISASASATISQCIGTVMISPPLAVRHWLYMFHGDHHLEQARKRGLPLLMMIGSKDNFTSEDAFMDIVHTMPPNTSTGAILKDADHFFRGREKDLMDIMGHWIVKVFPQCNGDLNLLPSVEFSLREIPPLDSATTAETYSGCM
mmetsp:Transcript_11967/g.25349  ORF Transcript_11967/g.25349 Transcript_11967/m.25349 type:complete len:275 (+) Transcript_11967:152-976(+)